MKRNFYRFSTLTAVGALGLGLMVAGCADGGGGTTSYPFGPVNPSPSPTVSPEPTPTPSPEPTVSPSPTPVSEKGTLKIGFDIIEARAEVPVNVASYNFYLMTGEEESQAVKGIEKKADESTPGVQTVTIEEVDTAVDHVVIEYLDADGKLVALNDEPVEIKAGEETELEDFTLNPASDMSMAGTCDYMKVDEEVSYKCTVMFGEAEDDLEREVDNEFVTYEIAANYPDGGGDVQVVEPKEGENGTFVGKNNGTAIIAAKYLDGIDAEAEIAVTDAEISELMITGYEQWEPEKDLFLLYCEGAPEGFDINAQNLRNALPLIPKVSMQRNFRAEEDGNPDMPPSGFHPSAVVGVNTGKFRLVGRMSDDNWVTLTPESAEAEGDSLFVATNGQEIDVTVEAAGVQGKVTLSYTGREEGAETLTTEANVSSIEATGTVNFYGFYDGNLSPMPEQVFSSNMPVGALPMRDPIALGVYYEYVAPSDEPEPVPVPVPTMTPSPSYSPSPSPSPEQRKEWFGPCFSKNNKGVEFSVDSASSAFYVEDPETGGNTETVAPDWSRIATKLFVIDNTAQVGDKGTFTASIEGCDMDMPAWTVTVDEDNRL